MKKDNDPGISQKTGVGEVNKTALECIAFIEDMINHEYRSVKPDFIGPITERFMEIMKGKPPVLIIKPPVCTVKVFGGLYGDKERLSNLIKTGAIDIKRLQEMEYNKSVKEHEIYVFLGNYSEYGTHGVMVMLILYALKIAFPNHVVLLRGPMETTLDYMFVHNLERHCLSQYGEGGKAVYDMMIKTFPFLHAALAINNIWFFGGGPPLHNGQSNFDFLFANADLPVNKFPLVSCVINRACTGDAFQKGGLFRFKNSPVCYYGKSYLIEFKSAMKAEAVFYNSTEITRTADIFVGCMSSPNPWETFGKPSGECGYWEITINEGKAAKAEFISLV